MKILIAGGHLTPALAFINHAKDQKPKPDIYFAGRLYTQLSNGQKSREKIEVEKLGGHFIALESGKLVTDQFWWELPKQGWRFFKALWKSLRLMTELKPTIFLSFGGYLAVPLALAAWLWRVPIVTHEQTRSAGIANRFIAYLATKVAVSYKSTQKMFPDHKTSLTGNPIRPAVLVKSNTPPTYLKLKNNKLSKPLLYITGGSQGSELINTTVSHCLRQLTKNWLVIHQCGPATDRRNYRQELTELKKSLPKNKRALYHIREWVGEEELAWIYTHAEVVVARAGANTVEEITRRQVPTLFIPLPFAHHDEQLLNARSLATKNAALILLQKDLEPNSLLQHLDLLKKKSRSIRRNLTRLSLIKNPVAKLWALVEKAANT